MFASGKGKMFDHFRAKLSDIEYRNKLLHTICMFFCFIGVGICASQTGPSLLDLQLITNTNTEEASVFITGASVGSMVGSLSIAAIFGRCHKLLIMFMTLFGAAASVTLLPWCTNYVLMIFMHALVAMFRAAFTAAANADLIRTWQEERRIFLQTLHFCFALGGTLSPLITKPFLAVSLSNNTFNSDQDNKTLNGSINGDNLPTTNVQYAYLINGVVFFIGSIIMISEYCVWKKEDKASEKQLGKYESLDKPLPKVIYIPTVLLILAIFFFTIAIETSLASYILTFVVTYLGWTKSAGANATSTFWACYAAWRFATVFFTDHIPPFTALLVTSVMVLIANVGGLFSSLNHNNVGVYFCVGLAGLSLSSQFPSVMVWAEESIIRLSPGVISTIVCSCTIPGIVSPILIGYLIQEVTPLWLFYLLIIESSMSIFLFVCLYTWNRLVVQPAYKRVSITNAKDER